MAKLPNVPNLSVLPKKKKLWVLKFPAEFNIQEWWLFKTNRPKHENGKWCDITISMRDFLDNNASNSVNMLLKEYDTKKKWFKRKIFTITLEMLDPTGVPFEVWDIDIKRIKSVDFGDLTVEDDGMADITLTLEIKNARMRLR